MSLEEEIEMLEKAKERSRPVMDRESPLSFPDESYPFFYLSF
jgi:hypothetical protein